jgi:hypothetical protein
VRRFTRFIDGGRNGLCQKHLPIELNLVNMHSVLLPSFFLPSFLPSNYSFSSSDVFNLLSDALSPFFLAEEVGTRYPIQPAARASPIDRNLYEAHQFTISNKLEYSQEQFQQGAVHYGPDNCAQTDAPVLRDLFFHCILQSMDSSIRGSICRAERRDDAVIRFETVH